MVKEERDWFLGNEIVNFGDSAENFSLSRVLPEGFVEKKEVQDNVVEYFASFDEAIVDFNIEELPREDEKIKVKAIGLMPCIRWETVVRQHLFH